MARRVWYSVITFSGYRYQSGKWLPSSEIDGARAHSVCTSCIRTYKQAKRIALRCSEEMIINKWFIKHGKRYLREIVLSKEAAKRI